MAQAKGILPRGDDRDVLYKSPRACGYFIAVKLEPSIAEPQAEVLLGKVSTLIDELVTRLPVADGDDKDASAASAAQDKKGEKVAAVAVGLAPTFFTRDGQRRFAGVDPPAAFTGKPLPNDVAPLVSVPAVDAEIMFYVVSTWEARVNAFVAGLNALRPDIQAITIDRGFQRVDGTEPFGYADGLRNVRSQDRPKVVFVHRDGLQPEEPHWADGGSYMAFLRILQRPEQMAALPDEAARDAVIGRQKNGTRLDLVGQNIHPHDEPADSVLNLPAGAHVAKVGPRGPHDDNQIFRRGLPFMEATADGQLRVGLNFCSFQGSLEQFDVVFNDWMVNPHFPSDGPVDALIDPASRITEIEKVGFYFVPPYDAAGIAAAVFKSPPHHKNATGRLVVKKRVTAAGDPNRRFDRRGFVFQILDANQQPIAGATFTTDTAGRGVCPVELEVGLTYFAQETQSTVVPNVQLTMTQFAMDKQNVELVVENTVPSTNPYGGQ
jgi:Dyp-type peroxidase family